MRNRKKNTPRNLRKTSTRKAAHPLAARPAQSRLDERFAPYYERVLSGDVEALVGYYKEFGWVEPDLGSAFYECLGYFATSPYPAHHSVVRKILKLGVPLDTTVAKKRIYKSWADTILPMAQAAKKCIRQARKNQEDLSRNQLWRAYWCEEVPDLKPDQQRKRREQLSRVFDELEIDDSLPLITVLYKCLAWNKIPKKLFFALAQRKPTIPPSQAVRRFVCELVGISESTISRKSLRKI